MTLPTFLVVGAGRSGTTSLHRYLSQHPDVFVPEHKAPSYYYCADGLPAMSTERRRSTRNYFVCDAHAYEALFDGWRSETAVGEVSPAYLSATRVPHRIADELPDARIVAVLRNPVDRVHARFVARRRDGLETAADLASIVADERRLPLVRDDSAGTYLAAGFVSHVLEGYLARFPRDRVRLYLYDDLRRDTGALLADLFGFLGVDTEVTVDVGTAHNRSGGTIANPLVRAVWTRSASIRTRLRPHVPAAVRDRTFALATRRLVDQPLDDALRRELVDLYADEIRRLSELVERDLTPWVEDRPAAAPEQRR